MAKPTSWKQGQSGNPEGRPPGAKDKRTALRALLTPHAQELVMRAVELAKSGDTTALRLCLERLIPPQDEGRARRAGNCRWHTRRARPRRAPSGCLRAHHAPGPDFDSCCEHDS
ncbi:MAG: DUF5681 domain-containing protein [Gammaproteobacteria bacterium]